MSQFSTYQELNQESKSLMQELGQSNPDLMKGFQSLHHGTMKAGALDEKTKELIAVALGVKAQCDRCIGLHVAAAKKSGASDEEIKEAIGVAAMMGGGPALMYALDAVKALKELS